MKRNFQLLKDVMLDTLGDFEKARKSTNDHMNKEDK